MVDTAECVIFFGSEIDLKWDKSCRGEITITLAPTERSKQLGFRSEQIGSNSIQFRLVRQSENASAQNDIDQRLVSDDIDERNRQRADIDKLREKLQTKWMKRSQTIEENFRRWCTDASTFFGNNSPGSSERESFMFLYDDKKGMDLGRAPFHKANLAKHLQRRLTEAKKGCPGILERVCRQRMMEEIWPGLQNMQR